jgi:hypothetical protein
MIKRLVIYRFRGIREGVLDNLGKINLLIGPNNSGKTAILEMLYLGGLTEEKCELNIEVAEISGWPVKILRDGDFLRYRPFIRLCQRHGYHTETFAGISVRDGEIDVDLPQHPMKTFRFARLEDFQERDIHRAAVFGLKIREIEEREKEYAKEKKEEEKIKNLIASWVPRFFDEQEVKEKTTLWHYLRDERWVYRWDKEEDIDQFAVWVAEGQKPEPNMVLFFDFHAVNDHFTPGFAWTTWKKLPDWEEKITTSFIKVFPHYKDARVSIRPAENKENWTGYISFPGKSPLEIDQFGDGARHAFKILAALIALSETVDDEHQGIFLWEDPELFMHPATLGRLLEEVINILDDKPIQVFISTQSLEVLAWMASSLEDKSSLLANFNTYSLKLQTSGILDSRLFRGKEVNEWLVDGFDPRDAETGMVDMSPISWRLRSDEEEELLW